VNKYLIHYFSGTGNTYHMVKAMEKELRNKGFEVELSNIEKDNHIRIDDYSHHIFCFPVYGMGTPSIMLEYISKVKSKAQSNAAIVCTSAGTEGQALSHLKYLLNKNGFKVFLTDMVVYTYNWTQVMNPQSKEVEQLVFKKAEMNVSAITEKIVDNKTSYKKMNVIIKFLFWIIFILFRNLGRRFLGKSYIADENCINCGRCKDVCPAKVIEIYDKKPRWNLRCECCQRCINICPKKAIQLSIVKLAVFAILQLAPIYILININKNLYHMPIIINIILYCIMFAVNSVIANGFNSIMEKVKLFRKILQINYTKKFRRNIASGFNIDK
jgi:Pyruvate/2-oxoacid:ferredoxin oxidoreductase delta subunit/putative NADPH-quinone reductase